MRAEDEEPARRVAGRKGEEEDDPGLVEAKLASNLVGHAIGGNLLAGPDRLPEPGGRRLRERPFALVPGGGGDDGAVAEEDEADADRPLREGENR